MDASVNACNKIHIKIENCIKILHIKEYYKTERDREKERKHLKELYHDDDKRNTTILCYKQLNNYIRLVWIILIIKKNKLPFPGSTTPKKRPLQQDLNSQRENLE